MAKLGSDTPWVARLRGGKFRGSTLSVGIKFFFFFCDQLMYSLSLALYMKIKIFKLLKINIFPTLIFLIDWMQVSEQNLVTKQCHYFDQSLVDTFINISSKGRRLIKLLLKPIDYEYDWSACSNHS